MDEPRVTCNVDRWLQYIAHLIKNTGQVQQKDSVTITDGAESSIRALKVGCTTEQASTKGLNLFDESDVKDGFIFSDGYVSKMENETQNEKYSNEYISIDSSKSTLTLSISVTLPNNYSWAAIAFYDADRKFMSCSTCTDTSDICTGLFSKSYVIEMPPDAEYIKVTYRKYQDAKVQVEYGSIAHDYEPYTGGQPSPNPDYPQEVKGTDELDIKVTGKNLFDQTLNYTLPKSLYRLSDSVYDYIDVDRGKIVRNVGVVTFDGSDDENWSKKYQSKVDDYLYYIHLYISLKSDTVKCDKLNYKNINKGDYNTGITTESDDIIYIRINEFSTENTIKSLKTYLSQNPITVYYQLATPTKEDIPEDLSKQLKALHLNEGTSIINSNIPISFKYQSIYKELRLAKLAAVQEISNREEEIK